MLRNNEQPYAVPIVVEVAETISKIPFIDRKSPFFIEQRKVRIYLNFLFNLIKTATFINYYF